MMGYTHAAAGAAGAGAVALINGEYAAGPFLIAVIAGTIGGVAIDIDTKDYLKNPKVTDAGRTRIAALFMLGVGIMLDLMLKLGIKAEIMERSYIAVFGLICFIILMIVGHATDHRTFTHTLLYTLITGICMYLILPEASGYYMLGCLLHLLLDMLNNPFHNHGIWLLYPIKGKGIALGLCKAARIGNKVFYFVAIIAYSLIAAIYVFLDISVWRVLPIMIITAYMIIAMHFVRVKSEREQRHIMHMHGEL